jgi:hypothetical protein
MDIEVSFDEKKRNNATATTKCYHTPSYFMGCFAIM